MSHATPPSQTSPKDSAPQVQQAPLRPRPTVTTGSAWTFPHVERRELGNGLTVLTVPLPGQEVMSVQLALDVPLASEPADLEGIGAVTVRTADEGTAPHPGHEFAEQMEQIAASYGGSAMQTSTMLSLDVPREQLSTGMELFAELLTSTALDPVDVGRQVDASVAQLARTAHSGPSLAQLAANRLLWPCSSRLSRASAGSMSTLATIDAERVREFWNQMWRPGRGVLVVAGDHADEVNLDVLEQWTGTPRAESTRELTTTAAARRVLLVDRPDAVQADVRLQLGTPGRDHPLWPALKVAAAALGGTFSSRLNSVLREEKGWSYGVGMSVRPMRFGAIASVSGAFRTEVAAEALVTTMQILDAAGDPLGRTEVDQARDHLVGVAPLQYDTAEAVSAQLAVLHLAGLPSTWIDEHFTRLARVGHDSANETWQQLLDVTAWQIGISGQASVLAPQLREAGFEVEVISPDRLLDLAG